MLIKHNLPRSRWKVGKIVELFMGKDQRIRSAKVFVSPHTKLNRPLSLLYPIECPSTKNSDIAVGIRTQHKAQKVLRMIGKQVITYRWKMMSLRPTVKSLQHKIQMIRFL